MPSLLSISIKLSVCSIYILRFFVTPYQYQANSQAPCTHVFQMSSHVDVRWVDKVLTYIIGKVYIWGWCACGTNEYSIEFLVRAWYFSMWRTLIVDSFKYFFFFFISTDIRVEYDVERGGFLRRNLHFLFVIRTRVWIWCMHVWFSGLFNLYGGCEFINVE